MTKAYEQFLDLTTNDIMIIIKKEGLFTPVKIKKYFQSVYDLKDSEIRCNQENKMVKIYIQASFNNCYEGTTINIRIDKTDGYIHIYPYHTREHMTLRQCYKKAERIRNRSYKDKHFTHGYYDSGKIMTYNVQEYRSNKSMMDSYLSSINNYKNKIKELEKEIEYYSNKVNEYKAKNDALLKKGKSE